MQAPLRQCSPHLSWLLRIPGTALSLSCWNQSARRLSRAPEALCFGGCCHLVSIFGLAAYQQCSLLESLLQQESWVQRQSAVPEVVGAGGRRGGDVGANGPAKDSVTSFAVISSPGELDPRSLKHVSHGPCTLKTIFVCFKLFCAISHLQFASPSHHHFPFQFLWHVGVGV